MPLCSEQLASLRRVTSEIRSLSPFRTLGVNRHAQPAEIRRAYRRLALKHHPDRSKQNDYDRFNGITSAFEELKNETLRENYRRDSFYGVKRAIDRGDPIVHDVSGWMDRHPLKLLSFVTGTLVGLVVGGYYAVSFVTRESYNAMTTLVAHSVAVSRHAV